MKPVANNYILIPGNTDLNKGDQSLVWESIRLVTDAFGTCHFKVLETGHNWDDIFRQTKQSRQYGLN